MCRFALVLLVSLGSQKARTETEPNTIIIRGVRPEKARSSVSTGKKLSIQPKDESRFDSKVHLDAESSLNPIETGEQSPSGFRIPTIRAQSTKVTEIYVDDTPLHDPYTGFPIATDLDLRAFGRLQIYQGVSPYNLATTNPIGSLHYQTKSIFQNEYALGSQFGKPFGTATWLKTRNRFETFSSQFYVRDHVTNGRYRYYSDNGTPYNSDDDFEATREDNHSRSQQFMPHLNYEISEKQKVSYLALVNHRSAGIPSFGAQRRTYANQQSNFQLHSINYQLRPDHRQKYFANLIYRQNERETTDPESRILVNANRSSLKSESLGGAAGATSNFGLVRWHNEARHTTTRVRYFKLERQKLERKLFQYNSGLAFNLPAHLVPELKYEVRHFDDRSEIDSTKHQTDGYSLSVASLPHPWRLYYQAGYHERAASLIEQFGNGGSLQSNTELTSENITHQEASITYSAKHFSGGLTILRDIVREKIVFLPTSANTGKAFNLDQTDTKGIEVYSDLRFAKSGLSSTVSYLDARISSEENKVVPGVPLLSSAFEASQGLYDYATFRWLARYRSEVYRDTRNSIVLPATWIHDAFLDGQIGNSSLKWFWGLGVFNVFDVKSLAVSSPETSESGRTAYSQIEGYPLPGRHFKASLSATF